MGRFILLAILALASIGCPPSQPVSHLAPGAKTASGADFGLIAETPEGIKVYRLVEVNHITYLAVDREGRVAIATSGR